MAVIDLSFPETLQLIANFRKHPIIYDSSCIGYNDRKMKAEAWKTISGEMKIHPETCKRKMESLLSSGRREKKLILKGKETNHPYKPKWRFWNYFKFLRGLTDDEEDPLGKAPDIPLERKVDSPWSTARMLAHKYKDVDYPIQPIKKSESKQQDVSQDEDEYDEFAAIGIMVEAELKKMLETQRFYAENLIHQTLYKGLLFQLKSRSEIRDTDFPEVQIKAEATSVTNDKKIQSVQSGSDSEFHSNIPTKRRRESTDSLDSFK